MSAIQDDILKLYGNFANGFRRGKKLGRNVSDDIRNFLSDGYTGTYAKDIFDLVKVGGLSFAISKLDSIGVEKVLASRWSGKTFSRRIWTNTKLLNVSIRKNFREVI